MLCRNICNFWLNGEKREIFSEKYLPAQYKLEKKSTSIASCFPKYLGNPYDYEETTNFIQVLILSFLLLFDVITVFVFSVFETFEFPLCDFFRNLISPVFYCHYTDRFILIIAWMWLFFCIEFVFLSSFLTTGYSFWDRLRNFLHKFTWIVLSVHKLNKLGKFW